MMKCQRQLLRNVISIFTVNDDAGINNRPLGNILHKLQDIRETMYKHIIFDNMDEPVYDTLLTTNGISDPICTVSMASNKLYSGEGIEEAMIPYGGETLYKGEYIGPAGQYRNLNPFLNFRT